MTPEQNDTPTAVDGMTERVAAFFGIDPADLDTNSGDKTNGARRTTIVDMVAPADTIAVDGSLIRCGPSSPLAWSAARLVGGEVVYRLAFGGVLAAGFATAHAARMAAHPSQYRRTV